MTIMIKVNLSNRHVHLCQEDIFTLFGKDTALTVHKMLGKEEFAAAENVTVKGPHGQMEGIRVLGPARKETQVEMLLGDCRKLGIHAPITESVSMGGAAEITIIGPKGTVIKPAAIVAKRHVHIPFSRAEELGIQNGDMLEVTAPGNRGLVFRNVVARLHGGVMEVIHLDLEEGNAAGLVNGDMLEVAKA